MGSYGKYQNLGFITMGGKGRVFKCKVLEFDNEKNIDNIITEFPDMKASGITHV